METMRTLIMLLLLLTCAAGEEHIVGGSRSNSWNPNVNFTQWASGERFYVGDWLAFFYQKGYYDVMQVNETDYQRCSSDHPLRNDSKGHSYVIQLKDTGPYYFICSCGQCWNGMKLAINVQQVPPPAPPPSSMPASSATAVVAASWTAAASAACLGGILANFLIN